MRLNGYFENMSVLTLDSVPLNDDPEWFVRGKETDIAAIPSLAPRDDDPDRLGSSRLDPLHVIQVHTRWCCCRHTMSWMTMGQGVQHIPFFDELHERVSTTLGAGVGFGEQ
jgi:hypothetical protein